MNKSIYDKIIEKGKLDAEEIIKLGKERAASIEENIINEANADSLKLTENNKKINKDKIGAATTDFDRLAKKEVLFKKKELIDKLIDDVLVKMNNLADDQLFKFVRELIINEKINGDEILKVSKKDYGKYLSLFSNGKPADLVELDKLNKELGSNFNLKLSNEHVNIDGGFVLISNHFDIDLSFTSILNNIKEKEETNLASILFKEED